MTHNVPCRDLRPTHGQTMSKRQLDRLLKDIEQHGVREPVKYVVDSQGHKCIVDGHHRWIVARKLGLPEIPAQEVQLPIGGYKDEKDLEYYGE
ncbi:ParB N-terminal domain-containing protein [Deinococcus hopiensis]|uniref:ParB N-terminal domain-containing protein n=1 Tax=Deinococcus hopiensis TaxID=309885 RepID=UPI0009FF95F3